MRVLYGRREIGLKFLDTFAEAEAGEPLLMDDTYDRLCISINRGSASRELGIGKGDVVRISRS